MVGSTWTGARAATMRDVVQKSKMAKQRNMRDAGSSQSKVVAKGDANHGMQEGTCDDERRDDDESRQMNDSSTDRIIVANTRTQSSTIIAPPISSVQSEESHNSSENSSTCYIGDIYDDGGVGRGNTDHINCSITDSSSTCYIGSISDDALERTSITAQSKIQVENSRGGNIDSQGSDSDGTCYIGSFTDDAFEHKPSQMAIRASTSCNSPGSCYIGSFSVDAAEREYKQLIKPKKKTYYGKFEHDQRLAAAKIIQTVMRVYLGRQAAFERLCAILIIQSFFRRWRAERHLKNAILSAVCIQKVFRGWFERDLVILNWAATRIQALIRGMLSRWRLEEQEIEMPLMSAVKIQACFRGWRARRTRRLLTRFSLWNIKEKEERGQGTQTPNGLIIEIPVEKVHDRKKSDGGWNNKKMSDGGWDNRTEIEARMKSAGTAVTNVLSTLLSPKKSQSSTVETAPMALGDIIQSLLKPLSPNNSDGWLSPKKDDAWLSPTKGFSATEALDVVENIIFPVSPLPPPPPPPPPPPGLRPPKSPKVKTNQNAVSFQLPSKVIIVNESTSSVAASIRSSDYDDNCTDSSADDESRSSHIESYDSRSYYSDTETSSRHITYSDTTSNQDRLQTDEESYTSSRRMSQSPEVFSEMNINRQRLPTDENTYTDASNRQLMSSLEESYQDERDDEDTGTYDERSVGSFEDAFSFHGYSDNDSQERDLPDPPTTLSPVRNTFCEEVDESIRFEDKEINDAIVKKALSNIAAKQAVDELSLRDLVKKSRILSVENENATSEIIQHQLALQTQARIRERYQEGTTKLFRLIQDERWEDVCNRVKVEPSEAKDWVVRSGKEDTWTRLPLHEACLHNPPLSVIHSLLSVFPESAMTETKEGELPLHLATNNGADRDVVNCLLAWHPMAVFSPAAIHKSVKEETTESNIVTGAQAKETICESIISLSQSDTMSVEDDEQIEHERKPQNKDAEIIELSRQFEQEDLTAMQLAMKVIQLEQVMLKLNDTKTHCREMIILSQHNTNIDLSSSITGGYTAAIEELKEILRSSRESILNKNEKIQSLESSILTHLREEEEEGLIAATKPKIITVMIDDNVAKIKRLMKLLKKLLGDTEQKKNLMKARIEQLGLDIPEEIYHTLAADVDIPEENNDTPAAETSLGISPKHMRWTEGVEHKSLSPSFISAGRMFESFFGEEDEPTRSVDEVIIDISEKDGKDELMQSVHNQVMKATKVVEKSQAMISRKLEVEEVEEDAAQLKLACVDELSFDDAAKKALDRLNNAISQFMISSKASAENDGSVYGANFAAFTSPSEEGIEHSASVRVPYSITSSVPSYMSVEGVRQTSCGSSDEDEDVKESASTIFKSHEEAKSITTERVEESKDTHYDATSTNVVDSEVVEKALALVERFRQQRTLLKTMCLGVDNASRINEISQLRSE